MSLPPPSSPSAPTAQRLIVIDSVLAQDASLLAQLPEGATVLVLDPARGALEQLIEAAAAQPQAIQTVDLLSHGGEGFVSLGGVQLDAASLSAHADELALLGQWLAPGADLLLYGCSVAEGGRGQAFIEALAQATGADVAASTTPTGATQLGGDSVLERWAGTGSLDAVPLDLSDWPGLLAVAPGLKDVLWNHTTSNFVTGFSLTTSMPLGATSSSDPGIYLGGNGNGWFEVAANGMDAGGFDLTALALDKFDPAGQFTITVIGTKLGSGDTVSATITSAAGSNSFVYPSFSAFTGLLKFRIEITGTQNAAFITFDSFSVANVVEPGAAGNQAPSLTALAVDPVFHEGASLPADLFRGVTASATEGAQNIDRITLTVSGLADGAAEVLRVDGLNLSLVNGATTTTAGLGLSASVSVSGNTATVTLSKAGGITSAQASALIDGLGYRNTADISADSTRVVTLTGLRDTGGTAGGGIDAKTFNIASTVQLKAATGNATDELVDVLWHHSTASFANGFSLATSMPLGNATSADPGIYFGGNGSGWFEVSANGTEVGGFDLTGLTLDKFAPTGAFTITVIGTKLGSGDTVSATITSAAGSNSFVYPSFSAFTGLLKFRIEISGTENAAFITFDSFRIDNVVAPGGLGNQAPSLIATAVDPVFTEGATVPSDLFSGVVASATESTQHIDRITLTVSGLADGAAEILRVDGKSISLVQGATTTTAGLGLSASVSVSGGTATVTLTKAGGITSAEASALIDGLGYRNAADLSADGTRVVTLTGLRDTGGTANGGVDAKTFNIASTVHLKAATGNATDELVDVLWNHSPSSFANGFSLATSSALGNTNNADIGIYLNTGSTGWFEVSADAVDVAAFDLTGLLLDKFSGAVNHQYTLTITGTQLGGGSVGPVTLHTTAGSSTFSTADFSALTGLSKFRVEISSSTGGQVYGITFDGFRVAHVQEPNVAPVMANLNGDSVSFTEGVAPVLLDVGGNATLTDADSSDFAGGNVTAVFTAGAAAGDVLSIRHEGTGAGQIGVSGSSVSYAGTPIGAVAGGADGSALVISLNASATPAAVQALLRNLSYAHTGDDPGGAARTVSITVNDGDGGTSTAAAVTVNVTPVNDAPTLTATGATPTFTEDDSAVTLFSGTAISTVEAGQSITALTLTVTGLADGADEKLSIDGVSVALTQGTSGTTATHGVGYSVAVSGTTATVTLTGTFTPAQAQTLVSGLTYRNDSQSPTTTDRTVTLSSITDSGGSAHGGADTTPLSIAATVHLQAVNDAPTLTGAPTSLPATTEDVASSGTLVSALLSSMGYADPDGPGLPSGIALTATTGRGHWQYTTDGVNWTDVGTVSTTSALLLSATTSVRYQPDQQNGETATLTLRAWDQTAGTASTSGTRSTADTTSHGGSSAFSSVTGQATLTVASLNDAPTGITLSGGPVPENSNDPINGKFVGLLSTTDVDIGDTFTYSIVGGADAAAFEINGNALRFKPGITLDFETQSSYSVTVRSTDAASASVEKSLTIHLSDENEAPFVAQALTAQQAVATRAFAFTVPADAFRDPDAGDTLVYSASQADGSALPGWLQFDSATREFSGTPAPGDAGSLSVRVTVTDSAQHTASADFPLVILNGPTVESIVRQAGAAELTNATEVVYTVTFSEAVTGVDANDFALTVWGTVLGNVTLVQTSDNVSYNVTVGGITGDGALRLDVKDAGTQIVSAGTQTGLIAGYSGGQSFTLDHTPPPAPTLALALDTGTHPDDGITALRTVNVTGLESGASWEYSTNGGSSWSAGLGASFDLAEGSHAAGAVRVRQTDAAGNTGPAAQAGALVIDSQAPTAIVLSHHQVRTVAGTDAVVGMLSATDDGTAGAPFSYALVAGNGDDDNALFTLVGAQLQLNDPLAAGAGERSVRIAVTDTAGNVFAQSLTITVLANALPVIAGVPGAPVEIESGVASALADFTVSDADDSLALTVQLTAVNGQLGQLTAGTFGAVTVTAASEGYVLQGPAADINALLAAVTFTAAAPGAASVHISVTDGHEAPVTQVYALTSLDRTPPDAPAGLVLAAGSDSGASATDGITRDATPTLQGQAEPFSSIAVYSGGTLLGRTDADEHGAWSFTPTVALDDGVHRLTARATDASDNESGASAELRVTIDTTAPTLPTLSNAHIRTHVGRDAVVGTLSANDAGSSLVFALVGGTGSTDNALFAIDGQKLVLLDPAAAGAGARSVRVSVTDAAGNLSEQSFQITVSANTLPTISGVPTAAQPVTVGQAAALADLQVADADGDAVTVTLTPVNGRIGGLPAPNGGGATWSEAEGVLTVSGPASAVNALLAEATFTATAAGPASIGIRVSDGIGSTAVTATYPLTPGLALMGTAASELLAGSSGNDRIDGGEGIDWLAYAGPLAAHALQATAAGGWQVRSSTEGTDTLLGVERLLFSDGALALDLQDDGGAAQATRLITTLLGTQALDDRALFGEVLAYVDTVGPVQLLQTLQELGVLSALAGGDTPQQLATLIYTHLVGEAPNDAQLQEVLDYQAALGLDAAGLVWAAAQLPLASQRAGLDDASVPGRAFEVFDGVLFGSAQDDTFIASVMAQHIDGREGIDTLVYAGTRAQHAVHLGEGGGWTVARSGPFTDQLLNVERLQFSDGALALDLDGQAGDAARLLATLAGAQALDDAALVGVVLQAVDAHGLEGAARLAVESGFAAQWAGGDTLQQLIANAHVQITGHAAADWEVQAFADQAQASGWDSAQTLAAIARLPDTAQSIDLVGLSQQGLAYEPWIGG